MGELTPHYNKSLFSNFKNKGKHFTTQSPNLDMVGWKKSGSQPKESEADKFISWGFAFESNLSCEGPPNEKFFYDNLDHLEHG